MEDIPFHILAVVAIVIVAMGIASTIYLNWLRIKNGYPLEGSWGNQVYPKHDNEAKARIQLLTQENAQLRAEIGSIKDRMATIERIVTDRGFTVASEIEALRDAPKKEIN